jgi:glycosyltransferase involved in cell wall biosynthesis
VLFGADLWFPLHVWIFQKCSGLPVDVYLVDDIEASASHGPDEKFVDLGHAILAATLRASDRVFAISPGFCEHLESRFGVAVEWLPVPSSITPPEHVAEDPAADKRYLVFVGALNHLYVDALRDLYEVISLRNAAARPGEAPMLLELLTYSEPARFLDSLPDRKWVEVHENLPEPERMRRLGRAHACFLPYSFLESGRLMVTTSFSCKILEYFSCGRPILVYGPAYASIPRYFKECGLEICAVDRSELPAALDSIAAHDGPELIRSYRTAWETRHSGEALRRIVVGGPAGA